MSLSMVTAASLPGTFLSGQVAASDQRFALAGVEAFCWALRTAYPPRTKKAGTSNERNKRERFRIVIPPRSRHRVPTTTSYRSQLYGTFKTLSATDLADAQGSSESARSEKSPRPAPGLFLSQLGQLTYRAATAAGAASLLTVMLAPPPGAPLPGSPGETTFTQSSPLSLKYEVSLALRSASRLFCCVPEAA